MTSFMHFNLPLFKCPLILCPLGFEMVTLPSFPEAKAI